MDILKKDVSKLEKILLGRVGVMVTGRCNLKCRLCLNMIPYWTNTEDVPLERLERTVDELFSIVERVGKFSFGGGEPFLSKSLPGFLEYMTQYQDKVEQFDLVTNATIVPNAHLVAALGKLDHMKVIVDNYGPSISKLFETVCRTLEDAGISIERRNNHADVSHCDGWFDMLEVVKPLRTVEQAKEIFDQCIYSRILRCNPVYDGKMFPCGRAMGFYCSREIPDEDNLYVDLLDTGKTTAEKRDELLRYVEAKYFPACAYCQGGLPTHQRHVPAEQLERRPEKQH